jgi:galactokinase
MHRGSPQRFLPVTGHTRTRIDIVVLNNRMSGSPTALALLEQSFGPGPRAATVSVPGRVNLIGEHIDYHNLPVLPMALQRRIDVVFRPREDRRIRAVTAAGFGVREFLWESKLEPSASGDWVNYLKAAAQAVSWKWDLAHGIDAAVVSDLPPAAGLSSSSALLTGFTLALLQANSVRATFEELMEVLPEGEYFVGTRGGGMDHAAVLGARAGCALLIRFAPVSVEPVPIPPGWAFLVAHSLRTAEKSGAVMAEYNFRRTAGAAALEKLGLASYRAAVEGHTFEELQAMARGRLKNQELGSYLHVTGEAFSVLAAVEALRTADAATFADLLNTSHERARDQLRISCPALDELVLAARASGALGARLTGAGFGGCAVVFCRESDVDRVRAGLVERFYSRSAEFNPDCHLITAVPSKGALLD